MTKNDFWELIEEALIGNENDNYSYIEKLKKELSKLDYKEIVIFQNFVNSYYFYGESAGVMMLCKVTEGGFTDDSLLYFTLWVISRGKDFYLKALKNPDLLVDFISTEDFYREFEKLMSIRNDFDEYEDDYSDETIISWNFTEKEEKNILEDIEYLNESKDGRYKSIEKMIDDIPNKLPKMCEKFNYEPSEEYFEDIKNDILVEQKKQKKTLLYS